MHPLTNTLSRGDSISGASPPNSTPLSGEGQSPANMHRGSISGIPGGGMPGVQSISRSPNKEASNLARSASMDEYTEAQNETEQAQANVESTQSAISPKSEAIPIRR